MLSFVCLFVLRIAIARLGNPRFPVLKPVCFCLLSLFFLSLNVATDSKDEELRVPPRRPFLGMYYWDLGSISPCSLSLCQHVCLHLPVTSRVASPRMACSRPAALPGLFRTCWFHLDYLETAGFKGGVDLRGRRMDVGNSRLQALRLSQNIPIDGVPVELLPSPPLQVFIASSFQSSRYPDWTETRHVCVVLLALLRTSGFCSCL